MPFTVTLPLAEKNVPCRGVEEEEGGGAAEGEKYAAVSGEAPEERCGGDDVVTYEVRRRVGTALAATARAHRGLAHSIRIRRANPTTATASPASVYYTRSLTFR